MQKLKRIIKEVYKFDYWLILITPVIDTINGIYILQHGATGFSIGTIYRFFLLFYALFILCLKRQTIFKILPLIYFPVVGVIRGAFGENLFGCITYAMKWILPIVLIVFYGIERADVKSSKENLVRCLNFWSIYVPASLIIEYIFKIGEVAYYNAGFKGLYFSTNDLALVLIVLFVYTLYKSLNINYKYIGICVLNFIAIILLSTKSSVFFAVISIAYMVITCKKFKIKNIIFTCLVICMAGFIMAIIMKNQLQNFWLRYITMWNESDGSNWFTHIMNFATSYRFDRIHTFYNKINENGNYITNLFFGWIYPDNAHVIEMDWHDLICQYGIIGGAICSYEYITLFLKTKVKIHPYFYIIVICMIYSILAGHVISGAFSGTATAIVFALLILNSGQAEEKIIDE